MSTAMPACSIRASTSTRGARPRRAVCEPPRATSSVSSAAARSTTAWAACIASWRVRGVAVEVERQLVGRRRLALQLAVQVAQRQVGQVVGALVGMRQVRRQGGVGREPAHRPAARRQRQHRTLGVVQRLRPLGIGQPGGERGLVVGGDLGGIDPGRAAARRRPARRVDLPGAAAPAALDLRPRSARRRRVLGQPAADLAGAQPRAVEVDAVGDLRLVGRRASRTAGRAAPGTPGRRRSCAPRRGPRAAARGRRRATGSSRSRTSSLIRRLRITSAEVLAQRLARLAGDLVDLRATISSRVAELVDPLGRGLRPDPGDAGQVVAGLADHGGEVGILRGRDAVLLLDRRRASSGPGRRRRASGRAP